MNVEGFLIDTNSLEQQLLKFDTLHALKQLSEAAFEVFCHLVFCGFERDGFNVTPPSEFVLAGGTDDDAFVCRIFWDGDFIAAALRAAQTGAHRPLYLLGHNARISIDEVPELYALSNFILDTTSTPKPQPVVPGGVK
jgi:hypothetical protein